MKISNFVIWITFLCGLCYGQTLFPMYPYSFTTSDGKTFGMGGVSLFTSGPLTAYQNPANLDSVCAFTIGIAYETRTGGFFVGGSNDVGYYPQSIGLAVPALGKGSIGLLYQKLMRWKMVSFLDADTINGDGILSNICLGYRHTFLHQLNLGVAISYAWGKCDIYGTGIVEEYNANGFGVVVSHSLAITESAVFAMRFLSSNLLKGERSRYGLISDTLPIEDNIPWELNGGIKYIFNPLFTGALQVTYRDWQRGSGSFIWGDYEMQFNAGLEIQPSHGLYLRMGTFLQYFYNETAFPKTPEARILFLTGSIGFQRNFIEVNLGIGNSVIVEHAYSILPEPPFYPERTSIILNVLFIPRKLLQ